MPFLQTETEEEQPESAPNEEKIEAEATDAEIQKPQQLQFNYSRMFLQYFSGSSSQDFINKGDFELQR